MKPFISLCMIVKNEETVIERCLNSVVDIVDEIIIVDTGSVDKTVEIAQKFVKNLYFFEWNNSFADARNFASSKATGDWILSLDADEFVDRDNLIKIIDILRNISNPKDAYAVTIYNFVGGFGEQIIQHKSLRLYKRDPDIKFYRSVHEQIGRSDGTLQSGDIDLVVYHSGYLSKTIKDKNKSDRNTPLVKKELEQSENKGFDYFNLGNEYYSVNKIESALEAYKNSYVNKPAFGYGWVGMTVVQIINCLIQLNRYKEALEVNSDAEKIWPQTADFQALKGNIYYQQNRLDDASEVFLNIVNNTNYYTHFIMSMDFGELYPHVMLGKIYAIKKEYQNAAYHFTCALKINRTHTEAITHILSLLAQNGLDDNIKTVIAQYGWINIPGIKHHVIRVLQSLIKPTLALDLIDQLEEGSLKTGFIIKNQVITHKWNEAINLIMGKDIPSLNCMLNQGCFDFYDLIIVGLNQENTSFLNFISKIVDKDEMAFINFIIGQNNIYDDETRYIKLLQRCINLNQYEIFEDLLSLQSIFSINIKSSIGNLLYENSYRDLAIDFYIELSVSELDETAYINILESFMEKGLIKEALEFALEILQHTDDFRVLKYAVEILNKEGRFSDRDQIINAALIKFSDSNLLKDMFGAPRKK